MMVGYLSGKQGQAAESIRRELEEPTSEASRWIAALRQRTRDASRRTPPKAATARWSALQKYETIGHRPVRSRLFALLGAVSVAALVLAALGLAWRAQENELRRLETMLARREAHWASRFDELNALLARQTPVPQTRAPSTKETSPPQPKSPAAMDGPTILALARIEAKVGQLGERLRETQSARNPNDPMVDALRRDIEQLKNDVEARDQSRKQESRELNQVVQEVLQLLRGLTLRPWGGGAPMQAPVPGPLFQEQQRNGPQRQGLTPGAERLPGERQMPGQGYVPMEPGQVNPNRGVPNFSGGYITPRMQRPGGPG